MLRIRCFFNCENHSLQIKSETKATCTKDGKKIYTCKRCGAKKITTLKAYKTLAIEKYKKYVSNLYDRKYKIEDVDKNGIPELLLKNFDDSKAAAYTYNPKTNKMVNLKSLRYGKGGWIRYNSKTHYLTFETGDTGGYREYFYKLSGLKLKKVRTITYNNGKFKKAGIPNQ